ncbi:MAG TPA: YifB family Mg chelatase-like AAA ATPase [Candidatus Saccharimonadales bacterium]|nr:YifB family Mg chelatase-like AAA ATPase [Candidatus Saccharimonadales bacterium]
MGIVAKILSVAPVGFDGSIVEVESHAAKGLPGLQIVGLGNKAIDEAKERVKSAIVNTLLEYPARKITINLAPAELPKDGTHYDLPIALSILVSSGQLTQSQIENAVFAGELALDGTVRPVRGAISIAEKARSMNIQTVFLPYENAKQAALIPDIEIIGISHLRELFLHLKNELRLQPLQGKTRAKESVSFLPPLLDEIQGQEQAKRALIIAAAGHHNILFTGSPGSGKTMLAKTLANLLPPLSHEEQIAVTKLHGLAGETEAIVKKRPFRAPHHTASRTSLIGGGTHPRPGEISLAHLGVLFLDEIPEYPRSLLEALRQPLEDKAIQITRASQSVRYPADFMMVATMNPCPCGYYGDSAKECTCNSTQILNYQRKLSGPFLDRIDLVVSVSRVPSDSLLHSSPAIHSQHENAQKLVAQSVSTQSKRYGTTSRYNNSLKNSEMGILASIKDDALNLLKQAVDRLNLSARSYFKIIKVARTIADIEGSPSIEVSHVSEALQYRQNS